MPQPKYNNRYISRELFDFYRTTKQPYEGFVIGEGYAFTQKGAMMTSFSTTYNPSNPFCQGTGFFDMCTTQLLDTSPEAVVRSLNLNDEQLRSLLIKKESNGFLTVNMGNGNFLRIPDTNNPVRITIEDGGADLMFEIIAEDNVLKQKYSTRCKMREVAVIFGSDTSPVIRNIRMPNASNDYMPIFNGAEDIKSNTDIDYLGIAGKVVNLSGVYVGYKERNLFKYESTFDITPSQWKGKNGKWYPITQRGNRYTGSKYEALSKASNLRYIGRGLFFVGTGISLYQGYEAYRKNDTYGMIKSGIDLTMGFVAFIPVYGLVISGVYFVFDAVGVFDRPTARITTVPIKDPYIIERDNTNVAPRRPIMELKPKQINIPRREQPVIRQGRRNNN